MGGTVQPLHAQYRSWWYGEMNGGLCLFYGDVTQKGVQNDSISSLNLGYGFKAGRNFNNTIGLNFSFSRGKLSGINKTADEYFRTDYFETVLNGTFDILNMLSYIKEVDRRAAPYFLLGIGYSQFNSSLYQLSTGELKHTYGFGKGGGFGGRTLEGVYILGLGVNGMVTEHLYWNAEMGYRMMFADALDAKVSGDHNDGYAYVSFGVSWRFGFKDATGQKATPVITPKMKTPKKHKGKKYKRISAKDARKAHRPKKVKKDKYNTFKNKWK